MTSTTHEHTLNVALGEVLGLLRRSWKTRSEQTGQILEGGGRPDILIEEASGWPVVIERLNAVVMRVPRTTPRQGWDARSPTQDDRLRPRLRLSTRQTSIHLTVLCCGMR